METPPERRGRARRASAGALRRRAAAVAGVTRALDGKPAADRDADQAGAHDRPGRAHRTRRDDLESGRTCTWATSTRAPSSRDRSRRRPRPSAAMMNAWYKEVGAGETIICVGRHHRRRRGPAPPPGMVAEGAGHEVARARQSQRRPGEPDPPRSRSITRQVTLYAAGDPPLLLIHGPLLQVMLGAVNIHGHVHEQESPTPEPARQRQRRAAELPAGEAERHPAIGAPADGRTDRSGGTALGRG